MQCGFAAAGMGHRPENSDKETTSLEAPSLPTSGGFKRPVRYPEIGRKTSNPRSRILDRSVSAPSVCSRGSGQAETVNHRAVKAGESSVTLGSKELPPSPSSDPVASANVRAAPVDKNGTESYHSPTLPSLTTSEQPATCFGQQKADAQKETLAPEPPVEGGGSSLSNQQMKKPTVERDPVHELHLDLKTSEKPGNELFQKEQNTPDAKECLCPKAASPLLANAEPGLGDILSEGRGGMEGEMGPSSQEEKRPGFAPHTCHEVETFMEVDATAEEFLAGAGDSSDKPNASLSDTNSECSTMEMELPKHGPVDPPPLPVSDLTLPGSSGFESAAVSLSSAATSGGQLSDQVEDPCISLTSALKELHQLLVVSSKRDSTVSQHENSPPLAAVPEVQAAENEISPEEHECTHLDSQDAGLSIPEHVDAKGLAGMQSFVAATKSIEVQEMHRSAESCEQDTLIIQESSAFSSSSFLTSSTTLQQLQSGECCACSSQCLSSDHILDHKASEESQLPSHNLSKAQDSSQSTPGSFAEETGTPNTSSTEPQSPPDAEPSLLAASPNSAVPQLPTFPTADIDQIVGAGFTPQEAGEALEHAGGNADLALLILLAKNIVVPT